MDKNNPDAAVFKPKKMRYARLLRDRPVLPNPNDFWLPLCSVTRNPHREPASTVLGDRPHGQKGERRGSSTQRGQPSPKVWRERGAEREAPTTEEQPQGGESWLVSQRFCQLL